MLTLNKIIKNLQGHPALFLWLSQDRKQLLMNSSPITLIKVIRLIMRYEWYGCYEEESSQETNTFPKWLVFCWKFRQQDIHDNHIQQCTCSQSLLLPAGQMQNWLYLSSFIPTRESSKEDTISNCYLPFHPIPLNNWMVPSGILWRALQSKKYHENFLWIVKKVCYKSFNQPMKTESNH